MNNGDLVFAESDLEPGDTPFEDDIINGKNGKPYSGQDVVGIYPIKKGFALVERVEGTYFQQGFRERNGNPKPYGKKRKVKNIDKIERKTGFDIDGDGLIDGDDDLGDDRGLRFRLAQPVDDNIFLDPLA